MAQKEDPLLAIMRMREESKERGRKADPFAWRRNRQGPAATQTQREMTPQSFLSQLEERARQKDAGPWLRQRADYAKRMMDQATDPSKKREWQRAWQTANRRATAAGATP